jgi:hypothetical protein
MPVIGEAGSDTIGCPVRRRLCGDSKAQEGATNRTPIHFKRRGLPVVATDLEAVRALFSERGRLPGP